MLLLRQFKSLTNGRMSMDLSNYPPGHRRGWSWTGNSGLLVGEVQPDIMAEETTWCVKTTRADCPKDCAR
jgi:hypothetical protein